MGAGTRGTALGLSLLCGACAGPPVPPADVVLDLAQREEAHVGPVTYDDIPALAKVGIPLRLGSDRAGHLEVELARHVAGAVEVRLVDGSGVPERAHATPAHPGAQRYQLTLPFRSRESPPWSWAQVVDPEIQGLLVAARTWPPEAVAVTVAGITRSCFRGRSLDATNVRLGGRWRLRLGVSGTAPGKLRARWRSERGGSSAWSFDLDGLPAWRDLWLDREGEEANGALEVTAELPAGGSLCFERPAPAPPRRTRGASVALVSIDTLRADALGDAPRLATRAASGTTFERAYALSNWTLPSHAALLLSRSYLEHGLPLPGEDQAFAYPEGRLPAAWTTLAEAFRDAGYATFATTEGGYLDPKFGFADGFEAYSVVPALALDRSARLETHLERLEEFLRSQRGDRPFFLFVHTYRTHDYLSNAPEYHGLATEADAALTALGDLEPRRYEGGVRDVPGDYLRRLYRAGVARTDRFVDEALRRIEAAAGARERLLLAITSDHGESFGEERNVWGHGTSLREEQIRVPLVLLANDGSFPARRVAEPVSSLDLAPTLLAWAGVDRPASFRGTDLRRAPAGDPGIEVMTALLFGGFADRTLSWARIGGSWKLERRDRANGETLLRSCVELDARGAGGRLDPAICSEAEERLAARLAREGQFVWRVTAERRGRFRIELDDATGLAAVVAAEGSRRALFEPRSGIVEVEAAHPGYSVLLFARSEALGVKRLASERGTLEGPSWPATPGAVARYADAAGFTVEVERRAPAAGAATPRSPAELERLERELRALGYLR
jgi:hypothetical protein